MTWHRLLPILQLTGTGVIESDFQGNDLLVFRTESGAIGAISAYCPHMQNYIPNGLAPGVAREKLLSGEHLVCPFHGWQFDSSGRCTHIPPGQATPAKVARGEPVIRAWRVRELDGWIEIAGEAPLP